VYIAICNRPTVWLIARKVTLRTYSFIAWVLLQKILICLTENSFLRLNTDMQFLVHQIWFPLIWLH